MQKELITEPPSNSVSGELLKLTLPLMVGNLLQTAYNLTDAYFLDKLGREELSAPSIVLQILIFFVVFGSSLAAAGTTLISQARGKGSSARINLYASQTAGLMLGVSGVVMLVGFAVTTPLLTLLRTPADVFGFARDYMLIIFCGMPFLFSALLFRGLLSGMGNTKLPLRIQLITVGVNVMLDPIMIFGWFGCPALGVQGAAIATVIARAIAAVCAWTILLRGKHGIRLSLTAMRPTKKMSMLLKIGIPVSLGKSASSLGFIVLQGLVNTFGAAVIAAFGVGSRIVNLMNMPSMAISQSTAILIGHSLGAQAHERVSRIIHASIKLTLGFLLPLMGVLYFGGGQITQWFVNDAETIAEGIIMFRILALSCVFFGLTHIVFGTLQGAGDTRPLLFLVSLRLWGLRVPISFLLANVLGFGPAGIWFGTLLSNLIGFGIGMLWLQYGSWKTAINVEHI